MSDLEMLPTYLRRIAAQLNYERPGVFGTTLEQAAEAIHSLAAERDALARQLAEADASHAEILNLSAEPSAARREIITRWHNQAKRRHAARQPAAERKEGEG